jgi:hypothetical protein
VKGQHWPAGQIIYLTFSAPAVAGTLQVNPNAATGRATADRQGQVEIKLAIPKNWTQWGPAVIVAFTRDGRFTALTPLTIVQPTATPTPTAAPKRPTATLTMAPIPIPPTAPPLQVESPAISIDPIEGPAGMAIQVSGQNWPVGQNVILALAPPTSEGNAQIQPQNILVRIPVNRQGQFTIKVKMPGGKRWEQLPEFLVVAAIGNGKAVAASRFVVVAPQPAQTPLPPPPSAATAVAEPLGSPPPSAPPTRAAPPAPTPVIAVSPITVTTGVTLTITGQGWPKGAKVTIALAQPVGEGTPPAPQPVLQAIKVNNQGKFAAQMVIPSGKGWDVLPEIMIVAYTVDQKASTAVVVPNQPAPPAAGG